MLLNRIILSLSSMAERSPRTLPSYSDDYLDVDFGIDSLGKICIGDTFVRMGVLVSSISIGALDGDGSGSPILRRNGLSGWDFDRVPLGLGLF